MVGPHLDDDLMICSWYDVKTERRHTYDNLMHKRWQHWSGEGRGKEKKMIKYSACTLYKLNLSSPTYLF